jgi:uncharacterized membrane protein YjjB (DUF3815 family)
MLFEVLKDALFAAMAAIGFGSISRIPRRAYLWCGLIAAIGHSTRFILMNKDLLDMHIIIATFTASFVIGVLAVFASPLAKTPAEAYLFPSLLPMIPGMYAYRSFGGLVMCLLGSSQEKFNFYFYQFAENGLICVAIIFAMVIAATLPIFMFKGKAFTATR